jgi:Glycosyl hydrolases family 25
VRRGALSLLLVCLAVAGCGGQHTFKQPPTTSKPSEAHTLTALSARCPAGRSQMGCSIPTASASNRTIATAGGPAIFPDVSAYQGTVDWPAVKAWQKAHGWKTQGAIFKLGEYQLDPYASHNAAALRAAGMAGFGYVFVRPGVSASTIIAWARSARIKVLVLDEEVPGIQGTAGRVTPALRAAGLTVLDYHSAGNVEDSTAEGLPCWVAAYGPSSPPACTTGHRIAWQYTPNGRIPGIRGDVDLSFNYGLLNVAHKKPKPKPKPAVCWGRHSHPGSKACKPIRRRYTTDLKTSRRWASRAHSLRKEHTR